MKQKDEIEHTAKMLRVNISRICLTRDKEELENGYKWGSDELKKLYLLNKERLEKDKC